MTWIKDGNGNKCSVEYWGSKAKAQKALDSLKNCSYCSDCSGCSDCSDCSGCSDCSRCYGCSGCSGCYGCSRCSGCSGCSGCYGCYGCSENKSNKEPNLKVIPIIENLHQKMFEAVSQPNALEMGTWHKCEKTHCRAGWVVTLAGEQGKELEKFFNTELAAMLIYDASCPGYKINPARFYDENDAALADMKKLAEGK